MKYSYKWLKELSGTQKNVNELAQMLLTHSFEVEEVVSAAAGLDHVVVGEVIQKEQHPDADRLSVAQVDIGTEQLQIVCGAPNLAVGQKVPVARVGAVLPGDFAIKKSKIRGIVSYGMICAEDELGLGKDHEGIMVLDADATVGTDFATYMGLDDDVLDIDILPNRGHDALSYIGMANEIRTLEKRALYDGIDVATPPHTKESVHITIDTQKCNRYIGMRMTNITQVPTPQWMKTRLLLSGVQSVNVIVDITNYVMLETGQPLHAFDARDVTDIIVRNAKSGERVQLLDDTTLELHADDIVVADKTDIRALAGVMGGKKGSITDKTTDILVESASFDATSVRFSSRRHHVQTESAYRFERAIDPNAARVGIARAQELFESICHGTVTAYTDNNPSPVQPWTVDVSFATVTKLLGVDIAKKDILAIIAQLGATVDADDTLMHVTPPTARLDLQTQEDFIEEIGRIYGYDKITKAPLHDAVQAPRMHELRFFERTVKNILVFNQFDEVRGYSFYNAADAEAIGLSDAKHIALLNPLSAEHTLMRRSLIPSLLRASKKNFSYVDEVLLFDIGRIYNPTDATLPEERLMCGAVVAHRKTDASQFYLLKGAVENLLSSLNIGACYFVDDYDDAHITVPRLHPSRRALIKTENGTVIGWIGEMDKKAQKYFGLKKNRVAACELDLLAMMDAVQKEHFYEPLAKYPFVSRDISMRVGTQTRVADVERLIYDAGGDLITDVDLFDLYENTENGERSMAFHIVFGSPERTLTADEVDTQMVVIMTRLAEENIDVKK